MSKPFDYSEFMRALTNATFDTPHMQQAQTVFLAMPEEAQRGVIKTCSHLSGIRGIGSVTAFEVFVAVARIPDR